MPLAQLYESCENPTAVERQPAAGYLPAAERASSDHTNALLAERQAAEENRAAAEKAAERNRLAAQGRARVAQQSASTHTEPWIRVPSSRNHRGTPAPHYQHQANYLQTHAHPQN